MVIITSKKGTELQVLEFNKFDVDLTSQKDFELVISANQYSEVFDYGARVFVPGTEYGGIIGDRKVNTEANTVTLQGLNWRGLLNSHVISPSSGADYKVVSGELNTILRGLISEAGIGELFYVPVVDTGVTLSNYQFNRYCTLYDGIEKMLNEAQSVTGGTAYRMDLKYIQGGPGEAGYVRLTAQPCVDYSETLELSQDNQINFTIEQKRNGVNHLICLGQGDLRDRVVRHIYANSSGKISTNQTLFGVDEIAQAYDYGSAETPEILVEEGKKRLMEITNCETFEMDAAALEMEVEVGDIIGGRDYITGTACSDYITNKIYKIENDKTVIEYTIGGEQKDEIIIS